jgi:hypothetical protein
MRSVTKLVEKAGCPDDNRNDTDPDAKRRTLADDNPRDAGADYSERNQIGEERVDHGVRISPPLRHVVVALDDLTALDHQLFAANITGILDILPGCPSGG